MREVTKTPDGLIEFTWAGKTHQLFGGPYVCKPDEMVGIKMAVEIDKPCMIDVPTRDFDVPNERTLKEGIAKALVYAENGHTLYVGCRGGIGRTGLFMAALAKTVGIEAPIQYVRSHYKSHAVETLQQMQYIDKYKARLNLDYFLKVEREQYAINFPNPTFMDRIKSWFSRLFK